MSLISLALLAIVLAVSAGETPIRRIAEPQSAEHGKRILFVRNFTLWAINVDDGEVKQLTPEPVRPIYLACPSWSPDGRKIAYFSDESGEYQLHIRDQNGAAAPEKIALGTPPAFYYNPRWSPDNKKILYTDNRLKVLSTIETLRSATVNRSPIRYSRVASVA